jgi:Transglycosylase SLT domain
MPTQAEVTNAITTASTNTGIPQPVLQAIAYNESSYGSSSHMGALGVPASSNVMQLTPIAVKQITNNLGYPVNPYDTNSNVQGSALLYQSYLNQFGGDQQKALAAYNAGPGTVQQAVTAYGSDWFAHIDQFAPSGAPDPHGYVQKAQNYIDTNQTPTGAPPVNQDSANIDKSAPPEPSSTVQPTNPDVLDYTPVPYRSLDLTPVSTETQAALAPPTVVMQGLDETPWFLNPNELTGNPKLHAQGYPVTFKIITDRDTGATLNDDGTPSGNPLIIKLNASMRSYNLQSSHIITRSPSRTGMHLTFWGMNADLISGECSTGLFLNQFGITSFLNMSSITSEASALLQAAFSNNPQELSSILSATDPDELRIAAQDAFVEFLSLFKNNGVTWYHPDDYSTANSSDQASAVNIQNQQANNFQSAFSPRAGLNTYEMKARNNDVYTRGYIVMNFRSSSYLGFFKSLSWVQDADTPFSWNFNFVFQVEKTLSLLYYPLG